MINRTRLISWNCRGIRQKSTELGLLLRGNPDVVCLQETKLSNEDWTTKGFQSNHLIHDDGDVACGGVSILIRNGHPFQSIPLRTPLQAIAVRCSLYRPITVCCVYFPKKVEQRLLEELLDQLPTPYILTGDFNAHSPLWGGTDTNQNGAAIESFLLRTDAHLANSFLPTHLDVRNMKLSAIDLTFCDPELAPDLEWSVDKDTYGSDHFPVHIQLTPAQITTVPERWSVKRADWEKFTRECLHKINDEVETYEQFAATLNKICESSIPTSKGKPRKNNSWFSKECRLAIVEKRKAFRKANNNPTMDNIISFKKARAHARRTIREHKRESFRNFVSSIGSRTPLTKVWKMIKNMKGSGSTPSVHLLKRADGSVAETKKEIADELAGRLAYNSSTQHYSTNFLNVKRRAENTQINFATTDTIHYNKDFSYEEMWACLSSSSNSAPGPDKITYEIIRHLPRESLTVLLKIYNQIWRTQAFPDSWRSATIIPIPKPGKDLSNASNYRPISLTSCLCKLMEKMVNKRLMWFLEYYNKLSNLQCGFRKNRSTIDHLVRLESFIREAFVKGEHMVAVFFDLEKAFDTTWKFGILKDLHELGLRGNLPLFIQQFLAHRSFQVRVGQTMSDPLSQEEGVPQGSILSPILFEIKINSIVETLSQNIDGSLYVDDFAICYRSKSKMDVIERRLQLQLNKLQLWSDLNGFKFSPSKTVAVHFCRKHTCIREPDLFLNNSRIEVKNETRFLGVIFDKKLSFVPHIKDLKTRCMMALRAMRVLANKEWGANTKTLLQIYHTLIRSKLDYASFIYGSAKPSYIGMLDPVHHQGLRMALGAFRTSPVDSLLAEADELPLSLRRKQLALQYISKIGSYSDSPVYSFLWNYDRTLTNKFNTKVSETPPLGLRYQGELRNLLLKPNQYLQLKSRSEPPWIRSTPILDLSLTKHKKSDTNSIQYLEAFNNRMECFKQYSKVYTDGSKSKDAVASAFVSQEGRGSQRLLNDASIFTAEANAISKALASAVKIRKRNILVLSDSLSVLTSLKDIYTSDPRIIRILEDVYNLKQEGKNVVFLWIPSHVGINETVDQLAKQALSKPEPRVGKLFHQDIRSKIKRSIKEERKRDWNRPTLNKLKEIMPELKARTTLNLNRRDEVRLNRLRIGHTAATHEYLLIKGNKPHCRYCNADLSVKHILVECHRLHNVRKKFYSTRNIRDLFDKVDPTKILEFAAEVGLLT